MNTESDGSDLVIVGGHGSAGFFLQSHRRTGEGESFFFQSHRRTGEGESFFFQSHRRTGEGESSSSNHTGEPEKGRASWMNTESHGDLTL
jgi:hypothetical protein